MNNNTIPFVVEKVSISNPSPGTKHQPVYNVSILNTETVVKILPMGLGTSTKPVFTYRHYSVDLDCTPPTVGEILQIPAEYVPEENCDCRDYICDREESKNFGKPMKAYWLKF
jgi:hypothetical protein